MTRTRTDAHGAESCGKRLRFEVMATTDFPKGTGRLMRFREGVAVGNVTSDAARAGCMLALLMVGVIRIGSPAGWVVVLPPDGRAAPGDLAIEDEVLWEPDLPTGGFPVTVGADAAGGNTAQSG